MTRRIFIPGGTIVLKGGQQQELSNLVIGLDYNTGTYALSWTNETGASLSASLAGLHQNAAQVAYTPGHVAGVSSVQGALDALGSGLTTAQGDITALQGDMSAVQGDITSLQGDMTAAQGDITSLQGDMNTAKSNITTLQGDMTAAQSDIASLQGDMNTAKSNITTLQGDMTAAQGDITALQGDSHAALVITHSKAAYSWEPITQSLQLPLTPVITVNGSTFTFDPGDGSSPVSWTTGGSGGGGGSTTASAVSYTPGNVAGVNNVQSAIDALGSGLTTAQGNITTLQGNLTTAQGAITSLQGDMTTAQGDITALQSDMTDVQSDLTTAGGNITSLQGDMATAKSNITSLQGNMTAAQGAITTLQGDMTTAKGNITTLQGDMTTVKGNITSLQGDITGLQSDLSTDESNIATLQGDMSTAKGNITTLQGDMTTAEGNITSLQSSVSSLQGASHPAMTVTNNKAAYSWTPTTQSLNIPRTPVVTMVGSTYTFDAGDGSDPVVWVLTDSQNAAQVAYTPGNVTGVSTVQGALDKLGTYSHPAMSVSHSKAAYSWDADTQTLHLPITPVITVSGANYTFDPGDGSATVTWTSGSSGGGSSSAGSVTYTPGSVVGVSNVQDAIDSLGNSVSSLGSSVSTLASASHPAMTVTNNKAAYSWNALTQTLNIFRAPSVSVSGSSYTFDPGDGSATVTWTISGGTPAANTVSYTPGSVAGVSTVQAAIDSLGTSVGTLTSSVATLTSASHPALTVTNNKAAYAWNSSTQTLNIFRAASMSISGNTVTFDPGDGSATTSFTAIVNGGITGGLTLTQTTANLIIATLSNSGQSPAAGYTVFTLDSQGANAAGTTKSFAQMVVVADTTTNLNEVGHIDFYTISTSLTKRFTIGSSCNFTTALSVQGKFEAFGTTFAYGNFRAGSTTPTYNTYTNELYGTTGLVSNGTVTFGIISKYGVNPGTTPYTNLTLDVKGWNSVLAVKQYSLINFLATNVTSGSEAGQIVIQTAVSGALGTRLTIDSTAITAASDLVANAKLRIANSNPPASATAAGTAGDIAWDANFFYVCVANGTWKRAALSSW